MGKWHIKRKVFARYTLSTGRTALVVDLFVKRSQRERRIELSAWRQQGIEVEQVRKEIPRKKILKVHFGWSGKSENVFEWKTSFVKDVPVNDEVLQSE